MARGKVRITLNKKGVGEILRGEGKGNKIPDLLKREMDAIVARAKADPNLPDDVIIDRRDYVGHDRFRVTAGIPGGLEAKHGIMARAMGSKARRR